MAILYQLNVFAEQMVFLVEGPAGKHVGISKNNSTYKLMTEGESWNLYPTISSDGTKLAYITGTDENNLRLVLRNLKSSKETFLTKSSFILHPQFSQNGKKLFFSILNNEVNQIGMIDLTKPLSNQLPSITYISSKQSSFFPAPFQNGELVVFQRNGAKKEIVIYNILDKKYEVIGLGMAPALSKDERFIAYTSKVNENWDIYIYDRFTTKTTQVTKDASKDFSPTFDRYNNLIYTTDRLENEVFSIYKQTESSWSNLQFKEQKLISKAGVSFYAPRISGDEDYLVTVKEKMIGEARSSFGSITHNNKIYVVGGHQGAEHTYPPESFTGRMTSFDRLTGIWSNKAPRLNPSHGFQLAAKDNFIFAFGGFAYEEATLPKWKSISVVEQYDTLSNSWKEIGHMPRRRSSNVAITVGDKVYLIGGWDATPKYDNDINGTFHDEIDVFDLITLKWSTLAAKLPKKRRAFSAFAKNGKIYLMGGISEGGSHFNLLNDFTEFDPTAESFKQLPKIPFATFAPAAGTLANRAFVFGGMLKTGEMNYEYVPHIYSYDFLKMQWSHTGRYLNESKGFSQVVEHGKCLGILGGHSYQNNTDRPVDTFETICL